MAAIRATTGSLPTLSVFAAIFLGAVAWGAGSSEEKLIFCIGSPDNHAAEFGLAAPGEGYAAFLRKFPGPVVFSVGRSRTSDWPYIHPAVKDKWAGGRPHRFTVHFENDRVQQRPWFLILGMVGGSPNERSRVVVEVNGTDLPGQLAPSGDPRVCFQPTGPGKPESMLFEIPAGKVSRGANTVSIRLEDESWILYDYVALSTERAGLKIAAPAEPDLLNSFRPGPMAGVEEIVFAARKLGEDPHWYANFGPTLKSSNWRTYGDGARLCRLNLATGKLHVLLDDPEGGIRDPVVHYDARKILFSYRRGGTEHYLLHEINADGSGLRRLTDGPYDDIEPIYLPDGRVLFVSTRCNRTVNCHTTDVAVLYTCNADGRGIRPLSSNNEHDNTPWLLPSGQVLYTRWEYVDRDQLCFHHLWVANPDGMRQTVFFGNLHPSTTMIDAKPIPGSRKIVASFSPGHGIREHNGVITVVDPRNGPDDLASIRRISLSHDYRDPWAFSEEAFMAARGHEIVLMDSAGRTQAIYRLPETDIQGGLECHEPRPLISRTREPIVPVKDQWDQATGRLVLVDVYHGRNMAGVGRGEVKKLLVLETLPKPMNYTGGMEPLSYGGTFTLERVLGTIPVEPDGSAYAELPALRSLFFVALDENELAVKRMQSFATVLPGETTTCLGCHEQRTTAPASQPGTLLALRRGPSEIEPIAGVPDVFDYPRDIQPILDRCCLPCHDDDRRDGGISLSGDRGPIFSISYYTITAKSLVADGRNALGNRPPRSIGSSASRLMELLDGSHYDAKLTDRERTMVRLWIESGAAYPGTYAALGTGMIGGYEIIDRKIRLDRSDTTWPSMQASMEALGRRCGECHQGRTALPLSPSHDVGEPPWIKMADNDIRRRFSRHLLYNLTRPGKSLLLLAPLAKGAGGFESCGRPVFNDTGDDDYRKVLAAIRDAGRRLDEIKRFDMPGFRPRPEYLRAMQRYGILPSLPPDAAIDVYATDRSYWQSLWYRAESK